MKVIDCFSLCHELDILYCRLEILWKYVDYFVFVESSSYHSGVSKNLSFEENKHYFHKYMDKIIHVKIEDMPTDEDVLLYLGRQPGYTEESNIPAMREFYQIEIGYRRGLERIKVSNEDLIISSDADEIPDPSIIPQIFYMTDTTNIPIYIDMDWFYRSLDFMRDDGPRLWWRGTKFQKWKNIKDIFAWFVKANNTRFDYPSNAENVIGRESKNVKKNTGCHFSHFGGNERVLTKMKNCGHNGEFMQGNFITDRQAEEFKYKDLKVNEMTEEHLQHFFDVATTKVKEDDEKCFSSVYWDMKKLYSIDNYKK